MTDQVLVSPTEVSPTHHLSLTDGTNTLGFILCDRKGNPTNLALRETPVPPTVMRVSQSDQGYADFEQPYSVWVQDDWSGGRGQEDFEEDKTRFYDSYRAFTQRGDIICGPHGGGGSNISVSAGRTIFFEYQGSLFIVHSYDDYSAVKMYYNGIRGLAVANTGELTKLKTSRSLVGYNLAGYWAKIVSGTGFDEETNWRQIVSNTTTGTNDTITVDPPWLITHDTTTTYVIKGLISWTEVTGHGLTYVTDVAVVDGTIYFAQGSRAYIRRGKLKADETWETWAADGTNYADFIKLIYDSAGAKKIWRAVVSSSEVSNADPVTWGTNLTFGTAIVVDRSDAKITGMIGYDSPEKPYILKENKFGSINEGVWASVPLGEIAGLRSEENGRAAARLDVYLYFSLKQGLERFYDGKLDDVGPDRDSGLPATRQGAIHDLVPYPGGLLASIDAGSGGYSSILFYNKIGWHEVFRSDTLGRRIRKMFLEVLPGNTSARLWANENDRIIRHPYDPNPLLRSDFAYYSTAHVISSWIYTSLADVVKYWSTVKIFSENLSAGHQYITLQYQVDDPNSSWLPSTPIVFSSSPSQEQSLSSTYDVIGRRFRYKVTLYTDDTSKTPRIKRILGEAVTRIPPKRVWTYTFYIADEGEDLNGDYLLMKAKEYTDQLRDWADSRQHAAPLLLHHNHELFDDIYVFIEPASIQPIEPMEIVPERKIRLIGQMTLREA